MNYNKEESHKIFEFCNVIFLNLARFQDYVIPGDRIFKENRGVRILLECNGKEYEETIFPQADKSLANNIILAVEKIARKSKITEEMFDDSSLRVFIFDFPSRILGDVEKNFEFGKEGLYVEYVSYKGFLFPSEEYKDKIEFLEAVCKEAALTKDSWQNRRALFYSFKVQEL